MPIQRSHITSLGIAMLLACTIPVLAQELNVIVQDEDVVQAEVDQIENRYRIGIDCAPAPEALRVHLRIPEDAGLLVNSVMVDSPAGEAGVKRFDIIVEANGRPVGSIVELVRAVNEAKDSELGLAIIHEGQERIVKVTPQQRDEDEIRQLRNGFADRLGRRAWPPGFGAGIGQAQEEIQRAMEQLQQLGPMNGFNGFRQIRPGIVLDFDENVKLPNGFNLKMQVERNGNDPATIKIERGNEKWVVTEGDLGELPEDIRPMVENMLNGNRLNMHGLMARPALPKVPAIPRAKGNKADRKMQERFDGLELKMQELQDAIQSIQGNK